jgi:tetratricopeptide (TPR) repeat protein
MRFFTTLLSLTLLIGTHTGAVAAIEYTTLPADATPTQALQTRLSKLEQLLAQADNYQRYILLDTAARTAMQLNRYDRARAYASELLLLTASYPQDWNYASALHQSRIILGLIAMHDNDLLTAKRYLLAAGSVSASDLLNQRKPDFSLAQMLLDKGEVATVIDYLNQCKQLWPDGLSLLDYWLRQLGKNKAVTLDPTSEP